MAGARKQKWNCAGEFVAGSSCVGPAVLRCGSCGAPSYCSRSHQMAHWNEHKNECNRMAQQMGRASELLDFPFSFTAESTELLDQEEVTSCSFLEQRELHLKGLWQGECECADSRNVFSSTSPAEWQLPSSMCPCTSPSTTSPRESIKDWKDYYEWRNLPLDSPVALLLHWPLTVYHALRLVLGQNSGKEVEFKAGIRIHYLGPEKELQILPVFAELAALMPNTHVHIDMVGPAVPSVRSGEVVELRGYPKCLDLQCACKQLKEEKIHEGRAESENCFWGHVTVKLWRGLYHDRYQDLGPAPQLVVAPNAGIPAFRSWLPTIKLLGKLKVGAIFTDYCEEAADLAAQAVSLVHRHLLTHPVQANPFRQPLSVQDKLLNLPTFSNCFMLGIG